MNWFYRVMYGRNGFDNMNMALIIAALLVSLMATVFGLEFISGISWGLTLYVLYRAFSKNLNRRRAENAKFLSFSVKIKKSLNRTKNRAKDIKTHRHFKCVKCGVEMRVPRGKGKIVITCPVCSNQMKAKT